VTFIFVYRVFFFFVIYSILWYTRHCVLCIGQMRGMAGVCYLYIETFHPSPLLTAFMPPPSSAASFLFAVSPQF
jgi:hypothetical protein